MRYIKGDRIELARNDNYWGLKPPGQSDFPLIIPILAHCRAAVRGRANDRGRAAGRHAKPKVNKDITIFTTTSNRMIHLHLDSNRDKSLRHR